MIKNEFPSSWCSVELQDITTLIGGGTPSRKNRNFFQGDIAWVTGADFADYNLTLLEESREYITEKAIEASTTNLVDKNSILITTRVNVGKVAIAQVPLCFSQDITALVIKDSRLVVPEYLAYLLFANRESILRFDRGTTISGIRRNDLARFPVPLPTLLEQREIVKILRQADHLRQLRTEADKFSERLLLSIFNEMFQKPKLTWVRCKLGDVISLEAGKNFAAKPEPAQKDKWGILKVSAVTYGTFLPQENKELPEDMVPNLDYQVKQGDLLITRANTAELVGASAIVRDISQNLLLPDKIWRAVFDGKYPSNSYFLYGLLNSAHIRKEISRRATGTSGSMKNISQNSFLDIVIRIPSDDEQDKFAEIVKSIWQDVHDSQAEVGFLLAQLMQSVQSNAFVGTLTESYRNKHGVELARLAQEREQILGEVTTTAIPEIKHLIENRSKTRKELSSSQQTIITLIEEQEGYSIADSLLTQSQLPSNQIQRNLDLLTQVGLIKAVKISVAPGELGRIFFTKAYRALGSEDDVRDIDLAILREAQEE